MRSKTRLAWAGVLGGLLLLAVGCGSEAPTPSASPSAEGLAKPNVQATIEALAGRPQLGTPTPTPVPAAARAVAVEFATSHRAITKEWDTFHGSFDSWRDRLLACDASSVRVALQQFGGRFSDITEAARALPRPSVARELADKLIQASEQEEEALRLLRDTWRPEDSRGRPPSVGASSPADSAADSPADSPADPSVFERVQVARSAAAALRRGVADALTDRAVNTTAESPDEVSAFKEFTGKYELLTRRWDEFHQAYDDWRRTEGGCDRSKAIDALGQFNVAFAAIAGSVRGLPSATSLRPLGEILVEAAEREEDALRGLRNTWQPFDETVFDRLDRERNAAGKLRRQVSTGVQDLLERYNISSAELE